LEFEDAKRNDPEFVAKYLVKDGAKVRPKQFAEKGVFGQDWLGNDERTPFNIVGTNSCRALHDNHSVGHIWEEFASITYQNWPSPGSVKRVINRIFPLIGGLGVGERKVEGGSGYFRNISLLSVWATAPFLHNNAVGEITFLPDGSPDYTLKGRLKQFDMAYEELMMSDNKAVNPHRPEKITTFTEDTKITPREDAQGFPKLTLSAGTPIAAVGSLDPHHPIFMKCDDLIENKGHQFGVDLTKEEKNALKEFLKIL
jgi:hypothetical protein